MGLLRRDSTNRIALAVTTDYSSPTVTITLTDNRTGAPVPGPSWPVAMTEIGGGGGFEAFFGCELMPLEGISRVRSVIHFDDGEDNCRTFVSVFHVRDG
jgi:hypothetical protein